MTRVKKLSRVQLRKIINESLRPKRSAPKRYRHPRLSEAAESDGDIESDIANFVCQAIFNSATSQTRSSQWLTTFVKEQVQWHLTDYAGVKKTTASRVADHVINKAGSIALTEAGALGAGRFDSQLRQIASKLKTVLPDLIPAHFVSLVKELWNEKYEESFVDEFDTYTDEFDDLDSGTAVPGSDITDDIKTGNLSGLKVSLRSTGTSPANTKRALKAAQKMSAIYRDVMRGAVGVNELDGLEAEWDAAAEIFNRVMINQDVGGDDYDIRDLIQFPG